MRSLISTLFIAVLITWAVMDFNSLETVVVALFERLVELVSRLADVAEARV